MATAQGQTQRAPQGFVKSKSAYHGPDPKRAAAQLELLQGMLTRWGRAEFDKRFVYILRKNPEPGIKDVLPKNSKFWNRRLVPFIHNRIQLDLDANMALKNILLKPRQAGYTTYVLLDRLFVPSVTEPGTSCLLISQNHTYATRHFEMLKRAYRHFGKIDPFDDRKNWWAQELQQHLLHSVVSNRKELIFDMLDSRIMIDSAEVEEAGQGVTIQKLHCSEVARWPKRPEETLANVSEAVAMGGTIDLESTANGMGGFFFEECMRAQEGNSAYKFHFHEWWWHDEYRYEPPVAPETLTDEEKLLSESHDLDMEQMSFRRAKTIALRHNFAEKYPEDPRSCFLVQGGMFFDNAVVKLRYLELEKFKPLEKWKGLQIFGNAIKHHRYLIGADVASGKPSAEGSEDLDYSTAWVIDEETGEQVAAYRKRLLPEDFAWDLAELGHRYNDALIAVERNMEGGTVILTLEVMCQYTNLYKHKEWWKKDAEWKNTRYIVGFPTTPKTRPIAINRLRYFMMESPELIYDRRFFEEALTFVRDKNGKPAAAEGTHDDVILAGSIVYYVRAVRLGYYDPLVAPRESYGQGEGQEDSQDAA